MFLFCIILLVLIIIGVVVYYSQNNTYEEEIVYDEPEIFIEDVIIDEIEDESYSDSNDSDW